MAMKVLNVDALAQPKRALTLNNKTHPVREITVQEFIDSVAEMERIEAEAAAKRAAQGGEQPTEDGKPAEQLKQSEVVKIYVEMILQMVPSVPREELTVLPIAALTTILKFCRGDDDMIVADEGTAPEGDQSPNAA